MMLAPQFSLRRLLAWVTASAFVCLIVAAAARGRMWAAGVIVALAGLVVIMVVHALLFELIMLLGRIRDGARKRRELASGGAVATSAVDPMPQPR
jgi:hypothetical protein